MWWVKKGQHNCQPSKPKALFSERDINQRCHWSGSALICMWTWNCACACANSLRCSPSLSDSFHLSCSLLSQCKEYSWCIIPKGCLLTHLMIRMMISYLTFTGWAKSWISSSKRSRVMNVMWDRSLHIREIGSLGLILVSCYFYPFILPIL